MHTQALARTGASQNERKRKDGFIFKLELNSLYYFVVERRMYAEVMADTRGEPGEIPTYEKTLEDSERP